MKQLTLGSCPCYYCKRRNEYATIWDSLNAKRDGGKYKWDNNPWVWVYEFERITADLLPDDQQGLQGAAQPILMPTT